MLHEDSYDLYTHDGRAMKLFRTDFSPPLKTDSQWVIMFDSCKAGVDLGSEDVAELPESLKRPLVEAINQRLAQYREGPIKLLKALLGVAIGGGLLLSTAAVCLAFYVSLWFLFWLILVYFVSLFVMIIFHTKRSKLLEKRYLFNMGLIVTNLNQNRDEIFPK